MSMKTIRFVRTLFYYDGPQVFEARDVIGGHYVAGLIEPQNGLDHYLVAGVGPTRFHQFRAGVIDLRRLLVEREEPEWYVATIEAGLDQPLRVVAQQAPLDLSRFLPETGFVIHDLPSNGTAAGKEGPINLVGALEE